MSEFRLKLYRGRWYAVWREDGKTKRRALHTADRGAAERELADFTKNAGVDPVTVGEIMEAYLTDRAGMSSLKSASNRWEKHLKPRFAQLLPEHITRVLCRKYTEERKKDKVSNWTIRRELGILRSGVLWHNKRTTAVFELPPEGGSRERYLTREEFAQLLAGTRMPHVKLFVTVALATAGRMGAILDLTWDRVDFKHGTIALANGQHKVKGRATVPMTPEVRKALEEAYNARTSNYVIEYGGEKVASIKKGVGEAAKRAGLDGVSAHVLRHTAAVWMASAGVSLDKIAQFMGHTDTRMTYKHYARFSPSHLADAASALSTKVN